MSKLSIISLTSTLLLPLAHAVGNAVVLNNCSDTTVYLWSVGSSTDNTTILETGATYTEEFHRDSRSGGITLKLTTVPGGIYSNSPETDYGYTLDADNVLVWYDISDVNGDPFENNTVALIPQLESCEALVWPNGVPTADDHPASCSGDGDLTLILCQEG